MDKLNSEVRVRFAPSPTGYLHIGNVRTALFNWLYARHNKGDFVLRIEDTDFERSSKEYEEGVLKDLSWLGIAWDEGPDKGGSYGPYRQSERLSLYKEYAHKLLKEEKAYYCFCTPQELREKRTKALEEGIAPRYKGTCRKLPPEKVEQLLKEGRPAAIRFKVGEGTVSFDDLVRGEITFNKKEIGDFIILRSDGIPPYNFAVVIDDNLMYISHVIRGEDHISNTPKQILLYQAFSFQIPQFAHLSMILGKDRTPLSKRHGVTSLAQFRKEGFLPEAMRNYLALLGWSPPDEKEILSTEEIIKEFSLKRVAKSSAVFDMEKLKWLNGHYIRNLKEEELLENSLPILIEAKYIDQKPDEQIREWLTEMIKAVQDHLITLTDLPRESELFFHFDAQEIVKQSDIQEMFHQDKAVKVIQGVYNRIKDEKDLSFETFRDAAISVGKEVRCKGAQLYHPIRAALTGRLSGPELIKIIPILEKGKDLDLKKPIKGCSQRLKELVQALKKQ